MPSFVLGLLLGGKGIPKFRLVDIILKAVFQPLPLLPNTLGAICEKDSFARFLVQHFAVGAKTSVPRSCYKITLAVFTVDTKSLMRRQVTQIFGKKVADLSC